jgi:hypothetical protein
MKYILFALYLCVVTLKVYSAGTWTSSGGRQETFSQGLKFGTGVTIESVSTVPTVTARSAVKGSLLSNVYGLYRKNDNGSTTNWTDILGTQTTIFGTANQITASSPSGAVTLSLPQNIHTGATPTFSDLTITDLSSSGVLVSNSSGNINDVSVLPIELGGTGASTSAAAVANLLPSQSGQSGKFLSTDGNSLLFTSGSASSVGVVYAKDVKGLGSTGGTATVSTWTKRDLNTLEGNTSFISLSSNEFTLSVAGTYVIKGCSPFRAVAGAKIRLYNVSDSAVAIYGTSSAVANGGANNQDYSCIGGVVTISGSKTFSVEYYVGSSTNNNDLGMATGFGADEVYTQIEIMKL